MDMFRELIELSETTKCIQMMQRTLNEHLEQSNRKMISLFVSLTICSRAPVRCHIVPVKIEQNHSIEMLLIRLVSASRDRE